jgi:lipopolysaccharide biosynthesis protein
VHVAKTLDRAPVKELCLFVCFAERPELKPHVRGHLERLLANGISVVLIVNTELPAATITVSAELLSRLSGMLIRENIGFDFGAWAHGLALLDGTQCCSRLFLINDSIVGPLGIGAFERLLQRVRAASSDVVGLTESLAPLRHLQSYFLVFNTEALRSERVRLLFARMLNLPTKAMVIDVYETRITTILTEAGLSCEALFPSISADARSSDDTSLRWAELIRRGFPYIKGRVLQELPPAERARLAGDITPRP